MQSARNGRRTYANKRIEPFVQHLCIWPGSSQNASLSRVPQHNCDESILGAPDRVVACVRTFFTIGCRRRRHAR